MTIEQDIRDSIQKNMPQAVGAELQALLEQGKKDAQAVKTLTADAQSYRNERDREIARRERAEADLKKHGDLAVREEAVAKRERDAEVRDLQLQLTAAKEVSSSIKEIAMGLVRNTEYRKSVVNSEMVPIERTPSYPGQQSWVEQHTKTNTTTTTENAG